MKPADLLELEQLAADREIGGVSDGEEARLLRGLGHRDGERVIREVEAAASAYFLAHDLPRDSMPQRLRERLQRDALAHFERAGALPTAARPTTTAAGAMSDAAPIPLEPRRRWTPVLLALAACFAIGVGIAETRPTPAGSSVRAERGIASAVASVASRPRD